MRRVLTIAALSGVLAPAAVAVPVILNGDLTGPIATGNAPPDWFNWQKTPDTCDALGPFNNTPNPWALSPNGGTFVRAGGSDFPGQSEAIAQNVTGFTPGIAYELSFYQANLGFEHPTSGDWNGTDGFWQVLVDGVLVGSSATLTKPAANVDPIAWVLDSVTFIAPAANFELALVSYSASPSGLAAYMGIDGVGVHEVPAPGAALVLAMGGVMARRRR